MVQWFSGFTPRFAGDMHYFYLMKFYIYIIQRGAYIRTQYTSVGIYFPPSRRPEMFINSCRLRDHSRFRWCDDDIIIRAYKDLSSSSSAHPFTLITDASRVYVHRTTAGEKLLYCCLIAPLIDDFHGVNQLLYMYTSPVSSSFRSAIFDRLLLYYNNRCVLLTDFYCRRA